MILDPGSLKPVKTAGASAAAAAHDAALGEQLPDRRRAGARPPATRCSWPARRSATSTPASRSRPTSAAPGGQARGVDVAGEPGQHPDRPRAGLRLEPHVGRLATSIDELRRDAVRRLEDEVRVQGQVPRDGLDRRRHDQGRGPREVPHDRPRPGDRLREVGQEAWRSSRKRSSFGKDILFELPFRDATIGHVSGTKSFKKAIAALAVHVQRRLRGRPRHRDVLDRPLPKRAKGVDPRLPTWHRQVRVERLPVADAHPQAVDPSKGRLVNWNNKPARGWSAADDNWSYGSMHRVSMLNGQLERHPKQDLASVTASMNAAATQDLRSVALTPTLSKLLHGGVAAEPARRGDARAAGGLDADGSSRLDVNNDGLMDAGPAPAIWTSSTRGCSTPSWPTGWARSCGQLKALEGDDNFTGRASPAAASTTSTRTCARCSATKFKDPFSIRFCGSGNLAAVPHRGLGGARRGRQRRSRRARAPTRPACGSPTPTRSGSSSRPGCCRRRSATRTARAASSR